MTVTSGFFNSVNHDRKYNAEEISSIFDGIILDGVYQGFGEAFKVEGTSVANQVKIGTGRAWFNHTWTLNDEALYLTLPASNSTYPRIDAIVLEVNNSSSVRANTIKYISGTAASSPTKPSLTNTTYVHQYPMAYITRPKATTTISAGNIENAIGTSACPIVTGVLEVLSDDRFIAQTIANLTTDFNTWFEGIKGLLDEDAAANLANKILELDTKFTIKINDLYNSQTSISLGTYLGNEITEQQKQEITNGTTSIKAGDYWIINGNVYFVLGVNTFFKTEISCDVSNRNHLVVLASLCSKIGDKFNFELTDKIYESNYISSSDVSRYFYWSAASSSMTTMNKVIIMPYEKIIEPKSKYINYIKNDIGDIFLSYPIWSNDGFANITQVPVKYSFDGDNAFTGTDSYRFTDPNYGCVIIEPGTSKLSINSGTTLSPSSLSSYKTYHYYLNEKRKNSTLYKRILSIKDFNVGDSLPVVYTSPSYMFDDHSVCNVATGLYDDGDSTQFCILVRGGIYSTNASIYKKMYSASTNISDNVIGRKVYIPKTFLYTPVTGIKANWTTTTNYDRNKETIGRDLNSIDEYLTKPPYATYETSVKETYGSTFRIGSILICI